MAVDRPDLQPCRSWLVTLTGFKLLFEHHATIRYGTQLLPYGTHQRIKAVVCDIVVLVAGRKARGGVQAQAALGPEEHEREGGGGEGARRRDVLEPRPDLQQPGRRCLLLAFAGWEGQLALPRPSLSTASRLADDVSDPAPSTDPCLDPSDRFPKARPRQQLTMDVGRPPYIRASYSLSNRSSSCTSIGRHSALPTESSCGQRGDVLDQHADGKQVDAL